MDFTLYEKSIIIIRSSKEFKDFTNNKNVKIQVMPEIIPFGIIGFGYFDELKSATGKDLYNLDWSGQIIEDNRVTKLSEKKKSKYKLYFSPIENGALIAVLVYASKNDYYYEHVTYWGATVNYFFFFKDNELVEFKEGLLHHN